MKPRVFEVDPLNVDQEIIKQAAEVINNRGLVAFPTETVYGLGANALDPKAVAGIFEAKKRPLDDPLIVHIGDIKDLEALVEKIPPQFHKLVDRFWPGPLTIVLKKTDKIPDIVTTGLDTVAVRMPSNSISKDLIAAAGVPIAAPSANLFSRPSPTTAAHVLEDLTGRVDIVLDGGKTEVGIESTVIELVNDRIIVLRPGGISIEDLRVFSREIKIAMPGPLDNTPGKYPEHYSPKAKVALIPNTKDQVEKAMHMASALKARGKNVGLLSTQEHAGFYKDVNVKVLGPTNDGKICASRLFSLLREFDADSNDIIVAESIQEKGLGFAVMNRLRKAAGPLENFLSFFHTEEH